MLPADYDDMYAFCIELFREGGEFYIPSRWMDQLEPTVIKWHCFIPVCDHHTKVLDYGLGDMVYSPGAHSRWYSMNDSWYLCGRHHREWKMKVRHLPGFGTSEGFWERFKI
jgi:hypothetical protein